MKPPQRYVKLYIQLQHSLTATACAQLFWLLSFSTIPFVTLKYFKFNKV